MKRSAEAGPENAIGWPSTPCPTSQPRNAEPTRLTRSVPAGRRRRGGARQEPQRSTDGSAQGDEERGHSLRSSISNSRCAAGLDRRCARTTATSAGQQGAGDVAPWPVRSVRRRAVSAPARRTLRDGGVAAEDPGAEEDREHGMTPYGGDGGQRRQQERAGDVDREHGPREPAAIWNEYGRAPSAERAERATGRHAPGHRLGGGAGASRSALLRRAGRASLPAPGAGCLPRGLAGELSEVPPLESAAAGRGPGRADSRSAEGVVDLEQVDHLREGAGARALGTTSVDVGPVLTRPDGASSFGPPVRAELVVERRNRAANSRRPGSRSRVRSAQSRRSSRRSSL